MTSKTGRDFSENASQGPHSSPSHSPLLLALGLAALGQLLLSQRDQTWTLGPGLFLDILAFGILARRGRSPFPDASRRPLPLLVEGGLFVTILSLALFFRLYHIDSLPAGMHTDQGLIGQCALRILHEGWRPLGEVFDFEVPELLLFYQIAGWFGLAGSSYFTFHLFFVLLSLASFLLIYWTFRQWAGSRAALLSLFLLAVMRWSWVMTRNGYPSTQVPFYLFGALGFWAHGRKSGKEWPLYVSSLFVGIGFYTYQAFKIVPLLMFILGLRECLRRREETLRPFFLYALVVFILVAPLLAVMSGRGNIGHREAELFLGTKIMAEKSLEPLKEVWAGTALMFNRSGDTNPRHNLPGHRMLDDATAVFFILGLAWAWRRRKDPDFGEPLLGFGVMLLTGLLSSDPANSNRLVSLTPFVALFAGVVMEASWTFSGSFFKNRVVPIGLGVLLLGGLAAQNAHTYFVEQAASPDCREAFGLEQTDIGKMIENMERLQPGQRNFFIEPAYFKSHTTTFLAYPARRTTFEFQPADWSAGNLPKDRQAIVFLEKDGSGTAGFLKNLCPEMDFSGCCGEDNGSLRLYVGTATTESLGKIKPWERGLKGVYVNASDWNTAPVAVRRDPVINFISKYDFPFTHTPPFRIRWTGKLDVPAKGEYGFQVLTTDRGRLWLDGKEVGREKTWPLKEGLHPLRLELEKDGGDALALHLVWKKPGSSQWEVIPATAFGKKP